MSKLSPQSELAAFRRELDGFSARLATRIREFRETGRFSDLEQQSLTKAQERAGRLSARVAEAEKDGTAWELLKAEAERDFNALADDIEVLERRSDAQFMGQQRLDETRSR